MSAADKQYGVLVDYTWSSDGASVGLRTQVRPEGERCDGGFDVEWARIGLELVLGEETTTVSWFGQGPHQSYPDTRQGTRAGWFSLPLAAMDVDYVRPQEWESVQGSGQLNCSSKPGRWKSAGLLLR